jgi:hypothetical protein
VIGHTARKRLRAKGRGECLLQLAKVQIKIFNFRTPAAAERSFDTAAAAAAVRRFASPRRPPSEGPGDSNKVPAPRLGSASASPPVIWSSACRDKQRSKRPATQSVSLSAAVNQPSAFRAAVHTRQANTGAYQSTVGTFSRQSARRGVLSKWIALAGSQL